jgi:hypothetical protein
VPVLGRDDVQQRAPQLVDATRDDHEGVADVEVANLAPFI